jgi:hypothetical protein
VIEKANGGGTSKVETVETASWRDGVERCRQDIAMARTNVAAHSLGGMKLTTTGAGWKHCIMSSFKIKRNKDQVL